MNTATRLLSMAARARAEGRAEDEAALVDAMLALMNPPAKKRAHAREGLLKQVARVAAYVTSLYWISPAELDAQTLTN